MPRPRKRKSFENTGGLDSTVFQWRVQEERRFCAAAFADPEEALLKFGYIDADTMIDATARKFWQSLKETGDAAKAADQADVWYEVTNWVSETPSFARLDIYAGNMEKYEQMARMTQAMNAAIKNLLDQDLTAMRETFQAALDGTAEKSNTVQDSGDMHLDFLTHLDGGYTGVNTCIPALDNQLGKLVTGDASILASRTSLGKTALAQQIAFNNVFAGRRVLYISTELTQDILWLRRVAGNAEIDIRLIINNTLPALDASRIRSESESLADTVRGRYFVDDQSRTFAQVYRAASAIRPDLLIVDHLDEFAPSTGDDQSKVIQLADLFTNLRLMGRKLGHHTLCVHQLSRNVEDRTDQVPLLKDLRWSGDLEQKADDVIMMNRPIPRDGNAPSLSLFPTDVWIRKNRLGPRDVKAGMMYSTLKQWFYDDLNHPDLRRLAAMAG